MREKVTKILLDREFDARVASVFGSAETELDAGAVTVSPSLLTL